MIKTILISSIFLLSGFMVAYIMQQKEINKLEKSNMKFRQKLFLSRRVLREINEICSVGIALGLDTDTYIKWLSDITQQIREKSSEVLND